ncbi:2OG-Fe(II) oxygenase [Achromobacter sp. Marseille-Q0513]|uniref:2OG-Fe(II) oxygenase n=1 Tax=Achromobacter sp. Marseille-Q0513 TaxID=2829161 RepID=UPI001BA15D89|nr:2OG-Fe(II) oxygenase [Achromobacter sp. Marseille-Q0513]MBR8653922.1 2OG-Fe(II) oxygenase [Achromobacter sp. Marseille-Q0513]
MAPDLDRHDWEAIARSLDARGNARLPGLLDPAQCAALAAGYASPDGYRSRIVMARHGFGRGEYKYFSYPLPPLLQALRQALYPRLAPIANRWNQLLGDPQRFPATHDAFLAQCHAAGQKRPTPLILQYGADDYNCLHQDLYGERVFPLQVAILLSRPGQDFSGGEFVMTETASSGQRAEVIALDQGDALVFTVNHRPAPGKRGGTRKVAMRHGVSRVRGGSRHTVGLIFHDAR